MFITYCSNRDSDKERIHFDGNKHSRSESRSKNFESKNVGTYFLKGPSSQAVKPNFRSLFWSKIWVPFNFQFPFSVPSTLVWSSCSFHSFLRWRMLMWSNLTVNKMTHFWWFFVRFSSVVWSNPDCVFLLTLTIWAIKCWGYCRIWVMTRSSWFRWTTSWELIDWRKMSFCSHLTFSRIIVFKVKFVFETLWWEFKSTNPLASWLNLFYFLSHQPSNQLSLSCSWSNRYLYGLMFVHTLIG